MWFGCIVYFRVVAEDGQQLAKVKVTQGGAVSETDEYGRLELIMPKDVSRTFQFSSPGYKPAILKLRCSTMATFTQNVILDRVVP